MHDSVEPLASWQDGLSPRSDEEREEDHLDGRPDQHQVTHHQRGLIDQEVVRGEQEARYQGENNTWKREKKAILYFISDFITLDVMLSGKIVVFVVLCSQQKPTSSVRFSTFIPFKTGAFSLF